MLVAIAELPLVQEVQEVVLALTQHLVRELLVKVLRVEHLVQYQMVAGAVVARVLQVVIQLVLDFRVLVALVYHPPLLEHLFSTLAVVVVDLVMPPQVRVVMVVAEQVD